MGIWAIVRIGTASSIPSHWETWQKAVVLFSEPFYREGSNDQGMGWNVLISLERIAMGFGLAIHRRFGPSSHTLSARFSSTLRSVCNAHRRAT